MICLPSNWNEHVWLKERANVRQKKTLKDFGLSREQQRRNRQHRNSLVAILHRNEMPMSCARCVCLLCATGFGMLAARNWTALIEEK